MIRDLFTEATEYVAYDFTDPKKIVNLGNSYGGRFIPFKSRNDARKSYPRDSEDWVTVTREEYDKLIKGI